MSEDTARTTQVTDEDLVSVSGNGHATADDVIALVMRLAPVVCPKHELVDESVVTDYAKEMTASGSLPVLDLDLKVENDLRRGVLCHPLGVCYPTPHARVLAQAFALKSSSS